MRASIRLGSTAIRVDAEACRWTERTVFGSAREAENSARGSGPRPSPISHESSSPLDPLSTASTVTLNSTSYLDVNSYAQPTNVSPQGGTLTGVSASFDYTFPAHSLTIIEIGSNAPTVTGPVISGYVYDQTSFAAIENATITVSGGGTATSGANGRYLVSVPGPGRYSITVSAAGHSPKTRTGIEVDGLGATANSVPLGP